ncbi:lipid-A-disaccharide synthase N-terminal domain-containing protein [Pontibacter ruber]|uniref:Lipid-A-disaccharide synthase N-terminal domain-containing protein n=1 Tax=Pontibacter ruber TaxID=1343895 RepID=A0ABW5CTT1_9BACT|nr:lipid-A-disaccharide synthase N-terminal domain-containing protein [Pontibacter ruber]
MHKADLLIYSIGLLAQVLFSARLLVQWIQSERAGRVLSPTSFWTASILASMLLMVYGVLRDDLVIIGGQLISYFIYLRNLKLKQQWDRLPWLVQSIAITFPFFGLFWMLFSDTHSFAYILEHSRISGALIAWGGLGQVIFTLRFVYQWYHSERLQQSVIPNGFWLISLIGSLMIISYAIFRLDPVLFIGQIFGIVVYTRNLMLGLRSSRVAQSATS